MDSVNKVYFACRNFSQISRIGTKMRKFPAAKITDEVSLIEDNPTPILRNACMNDCVVKAVLPGVV